MKVKEIYNFLNDLYPTDTSRDFDNVGLLVGNPEAVVKKTLVALDCSIETVNKAVAEKCELIITHHPVIFTPLKKVLSDSVVYKLIKNDISVISMHTNLDIAENGVSECLCRAIGLNKISSKTSHNGFILKSGFISPISAKGFAEHIKAKIGGNISFVDGGKPIERVLVCSGGGGEFVFDAKTLGFDAFVAAEIKHNQLIFARDNHLSVFSVGHFESEDVVIEPLKQLLSKNFTDIVFTTYHPDFIKPI